MIIRLYSNKDEFEDIEFRSGLNVVLGEIRLKKDRERDTHNLGKSTLCQVLDFCLLKQRDKKCFLFKHEELFRDYVFYLELQLADGRYLTIRRGVTNPSKISLYVSRDRGADARELDEEGWTHSRLPFEKAKSLVDGYLGYTSLQPWDYRKVVPYLLRSQVDFNNVFKPLVFQGPDKDWKPFLLHAMGFDNSVFERRYELETEIESLKTQESSLANSLPRGTADSSELDALIAIKQREVENTQMFLDEFKLDPQDHNAVKTLVEDVDEQSTALNNQRYELRYSIAQIEKSLDKEKLLFSTTEAKKLFDEAGVLFDGQIKRSFDQLLDFNRDITEERRSYLTDDLKDAKAELKDVEAKLRDLDDRRSKLLGQLTCHDAMSKYKAETNDLVESKTELEALKQRREHIGELQKVRQQIVSKQAELAACDGEIRENIDQVSSADQDGLFSRLRREFDDIVNDVVNQHGMLSVSANSNGHAEFRAEIVNKDGISTNQDEGVTYKKLLCIAFDLALILAHDGRGFPTFVYHDDAFGSLDNRKKESLRNVMRKCADRGVQQVVTVIDSDLPSPDFFDADEIVLRLHDAGDDGRLFKIPEW